MTTIQDLIDNWAMGRGIPERKLVFVHQYLGITREQWFDLLKYGAGGYDVLDRIEVRDEP